MNGPADRNLLFGVLAIQMDLITRDQLVAAMTAWVLVKHLPLGQVLQDQGVVAPVDRDLLERMVDRHVERHGGDLHKSLGALKGDGTVSMPRAALRPVDDPDVRASLLHLPEPGSTEIDPDDGPGASGESSSRVGGRFVILRKHAEGGLGEVYLARDLQLGREVALKKIQPKYESIATIRDRFVVEAEITGNLEHPGIVPVYALGKDKGDRPFYAMRFLQDHNFKEAIARFHAPASPRAEPPSTEEGPGSDPNAPFPRAPAEPVPQEEQDTETSAGPEASSVIAPGPTRLPRSRYESREFRQLLGRFVDVCEVLAYAHSKGVLHRDLKPSNVMLGRYGETLVVDWGLAKATGRRDTLAQAANLDEETLKPASGGGDSTERGHPIGTPAYMSPEQARGTLDAMGPHTDVYGLGAILYGLLTGHAPIEGETDNESVYQRIERGEIAAPRALRPSVPPALEAVCRKAMAVKPGDRYGSARALADDVEHWLADEPVSAYRDPVSVRVRRWMKRHRTLVTTAAAALAMAALGLGVVSAVQTRARNDLAAKNSELNRANTAQAASNTALDLQRRRAEAYEAHAIEAVKRFRDAVSENPELKENPGLEDLRKTLLKGPLAFFRSLRDRLQADRDTRPEALVRLGSASYELGMLTNEIGDKQDALTAFRESLAIRRKLADAYPTVTEYQSDLAHCYNIVGALLSATGKPSEALAAYEQALAIRRKLADAHPTITKYQSDLASSHNSIGTLLSATGKPSEALAAHEQALAIQRKLVDAHPTVTNYQIRLAFSHNVIGILLSETGRPSEAMAAYEKARAIQRKLADAHPTVTLYQRNLAGSHNNIGNLLSATGKRSEALAAYQQALVIRKKLADAYPTVTEYQSNLAGSHVNIGLLLSETGKPTEAMAAFQQALAIRRKLADAYPTVTEYQSNLAGSHNAIGILLKNSGKPSEAMVAFEQALAIRRKLADANPTITKYQSDLAGSHNSIGNLLKSTGKPSEALAAYMKALAIWRKLAVAHPESPEFASALGSVLNNIALIDLAAKRFDEARDRLQQAIAWQKKALAVNPRKPTYRQFLTGSLNHLITAAGGLGDTALAAEAQLALVELRATDPKFTEMDARLKNVLGGEAPKDNAERLALAQRAYDLGRYVAATRLWADALEADPKLADDRQAQHRYNAACAAALAALGAGNGEPAPDDAAKVRLRDQALEWLKAELSTWAKLVDSGPPEDKAFMVKTLRHWQVVADLAGTRDVEALKVLPEDERADWRQLWTRVKALADSGESNNQGPAMPTGVEAFAR
jgi:serine/threonine-protein kinase